MSDDKRPINITSFNQMGGITAHSVNIGAQPRRLDDGLRSQLKSMIPRDKKVNVTAQMGDGEAFQFAEAIRSYLASSGYDVEGVDQAVFAQAVMGQIVEPGPDRTRIIIGTRQ